MSMRRLEYLVSAQAERTPETTAIVMGRQTLTYGELEDTSNRLAHLLLELGCGNGERVCLFVPKSINAIIGMLASLKAGACYVPIDLDSPAPRLRKIVEACSPVAALVDPKAARLLDTVLGDTSLDPRIVSVADRPVAVGQTNSDSDLRRLSSLPAGRPQVESSDRDPAHILFTSGSTGTPKGVVITHRNVVGFLDWACDYFAIAAGEQVSGHPPLHFDLSTFDIFGSLSHGATLHLVPPQLNLLAPRLAQFMRDAELDQWFSVPSVLTYMAKFDVVRQGDFPRMQRLLWCGEVLPTPTLIYWMKRLPHVRFTNLYGPTEATIASSYHTVDSCPVDELEDIPIGVACHGEELLVLDDRLEPTAVDEIGEIYIRGVGLSPGYWLDESKTAAAFVQRRQGAEPSDKIYKTGDLGKVGSDGLVRYLGRTDSQIKSRGHRIELGEIETALNALEYLRESAVVGVDVGGFEGAAICCAYVGSDADDVVPTKLRSDLAGAVPKYMLPVRWKAFDSLPKNANGKIDRRAIGELFERDLDEQKSPKKVTQQA